jgi:Zn-dependent metalloprotease
MRAFRNVVTCAAVAVFFFASNPQITGQAPLENGRSVSIAAVQDALPETLARIDAMLSLGRLNITGIADDTMIAGRSIERLGQFHEGLPVFGGQAVRQMDGRAIVSVTGRLYEDIAVDLMPSISPARANAAAIESLGAGANVRGDTTLGILPVAGGYRLAYRMQVLSDWAIRDVYVDAHSGAVVLSINGIRTQLTIGEGNTIFGTLRKMSTSQTASTYEAVDKGRPSEAFTLAFPGTPGRFTAFLNTLLLFNADIATDSDNVWTDGPTVDAHVYQGWVYDYYFKRFGRRGMDDHDIEVDAIVHPLNRSEANRQPPDIVGNYINNAFYCCEGLLLFGDGDGRLFNFLAGGFDVVAHEWTHGVTEFTSNLTYRDESGALNEAFSDIMGAAIEFFYYPAGSGRDQADWLIAEDVYLAAPGFLRSLSDPSRKGHPDHYSLRQFIGTNSDDGGVHFNMTIATHAFYLAVAGGRNRVSGISVPGVGLGNIEKMERIFYRAFTQLLSPDARFSDARRATLLAATDLYGAGSNERAQVELAWTAVGVN